MSKLFKLLSLSPLFVMNLANAQDAVNIQDITMQGGDKKSFLIYFMCLFASNAILAFILTWLFPKFFDKTVKNAVKLKKYKLLFRGMIRLIALLFFATIALFSQVGFTISIVIFSLLFLVYFAGLSVSGMYLLNLILKKKAISFLKLSNMHKFVSLVYANFMVFLLIIPMVWFVPTYKIVKEGELIGEINFVSNGFVFLLAAFGVGVLCTHVRELFDKNRAKL